MAKSMTSGKAMASDTLSKRTEVLIEIRRAETDGGKGIYFNELVRRMESRVSRVTVSKALDSLFDLGYLTSKWELDASSNNWRKMISISNESKQFVDDAIEDYRKSGLLRD